MSKLYITSDWHLNHRNIVALEGRPHDYQEQIIKSLSVVKPEDTVINIGDLYLGNAEQFLPLFERIYAANPGFHAATKLLIRGNHDALSRAKYTSIGMVYVSSVVMQDIYFNHHGVVTLPTDATSQIFGHYHTAKPPSGLAPGRKFSIEDQNYKLVEISQFLKKVPLVQPIKLW